MSGFRSLKQIATGMGTPRSTGADPYAGGVMTKHGWFPFEGEGSLKEHGGRENYDSNGELFIQFPYAVSKTTGPVYRAIPAHVVDSHANGRTMTRKDYEQEESNDEPTH